MPINRLCYILPTADMGAEVVVNTYTTDTNTDTDTNRGSKREKKNGRNRHAQIASVFRRSIGRLYGSKWKWSGFCHCSGTLKEEQVTLAFHDITGVELCQAQKVDSNQQPRIFSYAELYIGSNGFSQDQVLGSGGFGRVYKAVLPSDGTLVAVKCLAEKGDNFEKTFAAELVAVAHLRHRNLVRLRGWCVHDDQLLLVYDYMPNRSLDRVLFNFKDKGSPSTSPLDFQQRHNIVQGLAAALFYLHEQLDTQIIHRDVKASNVMLDSHYNARLGDFGLARWLEHDLQSRIINNKTTPSMTIRNSNYDQFRLAETTRIGGTIGYLPPESFQKRYVATAKSDVFSFGIVVLEVASGRRAVDLAYPDDKIILLDWVRRLADQGKLLLAGDARLSDGSYKLYDMERSIHVGLLCTLHNPKSRPNMKWVLDALSDNILGKLPALPSFKAHPLYISLSSSSDSSSTGKSTTITVTSSSSPTTATVSPTSTIYITAAGKTIFITADDGDISGPTESKRQLLSPFPLVETPREIPYAEIVSATNNFSDEHRVAEIDFGTAYRGILEDGNYHVLVKRLGMKTCPALRARFSTELQNLGRLRHRNLVQLRGWCTEQGEMLVVYDFLASRLLSNMLFHNGTSSKSGHPILCWHHRYTIIRSLASAILYLHDEWDEQVIHRNITSSSIVVDPDMNPRLSSFALAEFLTRNEHGHHVATTDTSNNSVRGIFGYMSPEYMESGDANTAADIYSFGIVVLELITGQMAVDFRHPQVLLVKRLRNFEATERPLEDLADPQLDGNYEHEEFVRLVKLGLACTHSSPHLRPTMRQIASILDGNNLCQAQGYCKEGIEEWSQRNAYSLLLIRSIQALGIQ